MSGDDSDKGAAAARTVDTAITGAPVTVAPVSSPPPAGPVARCLYRVRASLGRWMTIAWTLALMWLGAFRHRAGAALFGRARAWGQRLSLFLTLTGPQAAAGTLRHWRDRALDNAARHMKDPRGTGVRAHLRRAWIAVAVRTGYALDHQANRLTWRLAHTLRMLERQAAAPARLGPPPRRGPGALSRLAARLAAGGWGVLEKLAKGLDGAGRLVSRVSAAGRARAGGSGRAILRLGRTWGAAGLALLRRFHARLRPVIASARHWLARRPRRVGLMARDASRIAVRTALVRARAYPWRRLGARLLVPAQCAAGILFGLSLLRRGDTVHMLAGGLLATAFVLMAVIYTWMQAQQPKAETLGTAMAEEAAAPAPVADLPTDNAVDPPPLAALGAVAPPEMAPPAKPRRKRARRKVAAVPSPAPALVGDLATGA
ncbi:hypothetical protein FBZ89_108178 [Nitrospirillum amazonense]|uniref:Uncharacterized protein n=1 Tax=Nitrospirillum amazonense TaxID=28077 RepID=A0A560FBX6_9PROT|nr:hypothetical protein [Nitrospirillum amazonense]TWB19121.1 hypothetical protein FBZ89_108178 [Nitrospirillum amazonense]